MKPPTFKKNSHEVQYHFNEDIASKVATVSSALKETLPDIKKAAAAVEEGEKLITERIADRSEHGWATVAEYEDDEDDERRYLRRKCELAGKGG